MTVEQNVLQQSAAQKGPGCWLSIGTGRDYQSCLDLHHWFHALVKHQQTFLNQLREITGINDAQILQQAWKIAMETWSWQWLSSLRRMPRPLSRRRQLTTKPCFLAVFSDRYISVGSQADARKKQYMPTRTRCATIEQSKNGSKDKRDLDVIDLTGDDKDDLQRAIALSLAESNRAFRETGMTDEEQAISRVLEASIAENKACLKRTPAEVWRDSRNPYDRKRQDKAPVGLKNVGNTCWFSAVIQSLFNLLDFRRLVLNYKPPSHAQDLPRNQKLSMDHDDLKDESSHLSDMD
ncbi:ubiquitin carboxyl-terminal hydrolase 25-like [Equus asinus]|uniref:ubiquitin carboxyl-terminal hydrolase 25-like n=1 Tax=Equus asinus TaxID=9793 RepID=UPI0038F82057